MNLLRNPEFVRNAWLELTPQRLLAMPALIGLLLLAVALADNRGLPLGNVALTLFVLITVLYGAKLAGDSMTEELQQGTWDSQRLSGLGAASMTVGKLLGGPVFAWYGGAFCLAAYVAASLDAGAWTVLRAALISAGLAVTLHALSLLSNLMAWRKLPRNIPAQRSSGVMLLLALIFVPQLLAFMFSGREMGHVHWYGWEIDGADFALLCTGLAAFWSVLGLYRTMREELAFRDPPTAWIAFLLFLFAFIGGWFHPGDAGLEEFTRVRPALAHLGACALVALVATYCLLFGERKDWVTLRRIVALWRAGEVRRAFELTPKWLATFLLTVAVAAAFAAAALVTQPVMDGIAQACVAFGFLTVLVRDGALLLGLNFARDQRRADAAAALYLAVLYALVPGLLGGLGLEFLLPAFWPPMLQVQPPWVVLMLLQAAAALDFARRRWQQLPPAA